MGYYGLIWAQYKGTIEIIFDNIRSANVGSHGTYIQREREREREDIQTHTSFRNRFSGICQPMDPTPGVCRSSAVALSRLHLRSIVIRTSLGVQKCQKRPIVVSKETYYDRSIVIRTSPVKR